MGGAVVLIGYGNVGHHLLMAFCEKTDFKIFVKSREKSSAHLFSNESVQWIDDFNLLNQPPQYCFLTVRDDQIKKTAETLPKSWKNVSTIVHCSGVLSADHLKTSCEHIALFYPLNSFSKKIPFDWSEVPIFIDASREEDKNKLKSLALKFNGRAFENDDQIREQLHLAAVMVNNFSNHWFHLAADFLEKKDIPFDYLLPLIKTTISKLNYDTPAKSQTGPAIRGDINTINKHMKMIENEELRHLYRKMSASINPSIKDKIE